MACFDIGGVFDYGACGRGHIHVEGLLKQGDNGIWTVYVRYRIIDWLIC
jgi:hypothetical protein